MTVSSGTKPVALITGASYGVGMACALALARSGFDLSVSATSLKNLDKVTKELGETGARVLPVELDLRHQESIEKALAKVIEAYGALDLLVNNAGANLRKPALDVTRSEWESVMATNLTGAFFITQQAGRHFVSARRAGAIITIASTHALIGAAERSVYGMSKAALLQMTRMLAVEWAPYGVRVNAVAPGRLLTSSPSRAGTGSDPKYMEAMLQRIPLRRLATAKEVAAAVAFLASSSAASITGQTIVLDGGLTIA